PNDILGPEGFGEDRWIDTDEPLRYTIRFENVATATAPAQEVFITQQLDADLDWRTFRVDDYGWSGAVYELEGDRAFHSTRIDLTETKGFYVDIAATIDTLTGIATWRISTVDPTTGEAPLDAQQGFLPTNDENGRGEGFVTYSIRPKSTAKTGDVIDAEAEIIFDTEEPIKTPPIFNTLDTDKPTRQINSLPETTDNPQILVSWTGSDTGSALANYTIYVSDNGGDYTPWLTNSILTESLYQGQPGHTYQFYALATDNAGNTQEIPTTPQASIRVTGAVNQPAAVILAQTGGTTLVAVGGGTDSYTLTLQTQPTAEVRISLSTSGGQLSLNSSELIFTPDNWNTPQSVVVSAVDDALTEGSHTATIQHSISSTDASYAGLTIPALTVQVQDNDASISGRIWNDADGNRLNNGEAGLAGWTVFLDANLNGVLDPGERSTLTDNTGAYRFDDLRPGVVSVAQVLQSGWRQTFPRLDVSTTASDLPLVLPSVDLGLASSGSTNFNFSRSNYLVMEDGTALTEVWISRSGDLSQSASVTLRLSDGTATGCGCAASSVNNDFNFSPITITFAPNQAMRLVPVDNARLANPAAIRIRDDSKAETSEDFQLQLTNPSSGAVIGDQGTATVTIIENDSASGAELLAALATTQPAPSASAVSLNPAASVLIDLDAFFADSRFASFRGQGFSSVIIDTGIDADHSLLGADLNLDGLADRLAYQYDFADHDANANDLSGHGTHIASIISSVASGSSLIALKVFKDSGSGSFADLERALQWVTANTAAYNIASVNLSLGDGLNWADSASRYGLGDEFAALASQGVLISAAAGNSFYKFASTPGLSYPGVDPYVIPVGAVWTEDVGGNRRFTNGAIDFSTAPDRIASFSQRELDGLPFLAPGILIDGARAGGGTISMGGTSQATAFV
ncbi:MAG: S8 family serine peptidase, partial [Cyanobium sp.]